MKRSKTQCITRSRGTATVSVLQSRTRFSSQVLKLTEVLVEPAATVLRATQATAWSKVVAKVLATAQAKIQAKAKTTTWARASATTLAMALAILAVPTKAESIDQIPQGPLVPTGRYADLTGYRLHYDCTGPEDAPVTVMLESGIGGAIQGWGGVKAALESDYRVCAYDRGGYGWSDPGPGARSVDELAFELHELVLRAQFRTPMVMVGHSFGGFVIREFAERWPELTLGFVFVDASLTDTLVRIGAKDGEPAPLHPVNTNAIRDGSVSDLNAGGGFLNSRRKAIFAQMGEFQYFSDSAARVEAYGPPPIRPTVVLAREAVAGDDSGVLTEHWIVAQRAFAESMRGATFMRVEGAGHNVHVDRPDAVAEAIRTVIGRAQSACASGQLGFPCPPSS